MSAYMQRVLERMMAGEEIPQEEQVQPLVEYLEVCARDIEQVQMMLLMLEKDTYSDEERKELRPQYERRMVESMQNAVGAVNVVLGTWDLEQVADVRKILKAFQAAKNAVLPMHSIYSVQLIPRPLWGVNLRQELGKVQWNRLRKERHETEGGCCQFCGKPVLIENSELHEKWGYNHQQFEGEPFSYPILLGLIVLCKNCHKTQHLGLASVKGYLPEALQRLSELTHMPLSRAQAYYRMTMAEWGLHSNLPWLPDYTVTFIERTNPRGEKGIEVLDQSTLTRQLNWDTHRSFRKIANDKAERFNKHLLPAVKYLRNPEPGSGRTEPVAFSDLCEVLKKVPMPKKPIRL